MTRNNLLKDFVHFGLSKTMTMTEEGNRPSTGHAHHAAIVEQLDRNYSCSICNGILIQAKTTDCNHIFCTYCLNLLLPLSPKCPECLNEIRSSLPLPQIDAQVEKLINSLPPAYQDAFQTSIHARQGMQEKRSLKITELRKKLSIPVPLKKNNHKVIGPFRPIQLKNNFDETTTNLDELYSSVVAKFTDYSSSSGSGSGGSTSLSLPQLASSSGPKTARPGWPGTVGVTSKSSPSGSLTSRVNYAVKIKKEKECELDLDKANDLLNMYEGYLDNLRNLNHNLALEESSNPNSGSGDQNQDPSNNGLTSPQHHQIFPPLSSLVGVGVGGGQGQGQPLPKNKDLENLGKELESVVELDTFIKSWWNEMKGMMNLVESNETISNNNIVPPPKTPQDLLISVDLFNQIHELKGKLGRMKKGIQMNSPRSSISLRQTKRELRGDIENFLNELEFTSTFRPALLPPPPPPRTRRLTKEELMLETGEDMMNLNNIPAL